MSDRCGRTAVRLVPQLQLDAEPMLLSEGGPGAESVRPTNNTETGIYSFVRFIYLELTLFTFKSQYLLFKSLYLPLNHFIYFLNHFIYL